MLSFICFLTTLVVLILPGYLVNLINQDHISWEENFVQATTMGLAMAIGLFAFAAFFNTGLFFPLWVIVTLALTVCAFRTQRSTPEKQRGNLFHHPLFWILLGVAATRFWPTTRQLLPPGWDPTFHLILANKIQLKKAMIQDWTPFCSLALHYPLGSHYLLVLISSVSRAPLHTVFKWLIPCLGILSTAQIYVLSDRMTGEREVALWSSLTYGFLAVYGSINYYEWGGLPNLLAMCFLLQCLILLCQKKFRLKDSFFFVFFATMISVVHHHTMVAGYMVLLASIIVTARSTNDYKQKKYLWAGFFGGVIGSCLFLSPYLPRVGSLGETGVFTFQEVFFDVPMIARSLGWGCFLISLSGLLLLFKAPLSWPYKSLWLAGAGVLMTNFVFFEYIYRAWSIKFMGHDLVAFTPSRFLTDFAYFLCIFIGWVIYRYRLMFNLRMAPMAIGILFLGLFNMNDWKRQSQTEDQSQFIAMCRWIKTNTPENTIVITNHPWVPYLSWRPTILPPLPISETAQPPDDYLKIVEDSLSAKRKGQEPLPWKFIAFKPVNKGKAVSRPITPTGESFTIYEITFPI